MLINSEKISYTSNPSQQTTRKDERTRHAIITKSNHELNRVFDEIMKHSIYDSAHIVLLKSEERKIITFVDEQLHQQKIFKWETR